MNIHSYIPLPGCQSSHIDSGEVAGFTNHAGITTVGMAITVGQSVVWLVGCLVGPLLWPRM